MLLYLNFTSYTHSYPVFVLLLRLPHRWTLDIIMFLTIHPNIVGVFLRLFLRIKIEVQRRSFICLFMFFDHLQCVPSVRFIQIIQKDLSSSGWKITSSKNFDKTASHIALGRDIKNINVDNTEHTLFLRHKQFK